GLSLQGDSRNDVWIFVLAVLLSSTLIYNSRGTIDRQAMDSLHYVAKLAEHIEVRNTAEGGEEPLPSAGFAQFFPTFVWAVRDFTLQLEKDGRELSDDEYLEDALRLRAGR
ncbi:GBP2 protein, partial [Alectura lathami]|nr:GBP2 protein [Alectura lathami]